MHRDLASGTGFPSTNSASGNSGLGAAFSRHYQNSRRLRDTKDAVGELGGDEMQDGR